ncbi:phosphotransferase enzyme family protein [Cordyceps fumosorosea ARSEF 2679]|uniref:Phosphotransferase enzyme family protein n=1 Tax=Cordyceps fumosorosea (strain ARSEF 2679) TaxID=1081104 RepID=A0A168B425_CORFA|nr:phosphotransferase enzyme family protein [Cordyceps fumosorosea ARSEF 2679]OAA69591.1 phosphotransferase enzyme family protein [Cordyceps fumosorosea ARSEF 2679]
MNPAEHFPIPRATIGRLCDAVLASLDEAAICKLASSHSNALPCRVLSIDRGSYNASVCLDFFGRIPRRLLRLPLRPAVRDGWRKVQSEAATLAYLRKHTSVSVPRVWAYGQHARVTNDPSTPQPYLLCDYIPGQCLTLGRVRNATSRQRKELFSDLIGIYSQFLTLQFPVSESLFPGTDEDGNPRIEGLLSMPMNELLLSTSSSHPVPGILRSAASYVDYHLDIVSESAHLPLIDGTLSRVKEQAFALHHLRLEAHRGLNCLQSQDAESFILTHPDLHYANIVVNKELRIQGLIDWEFAGTVPLCLFRPPAWATGHDGRGFLPPPKEISSDFQMALQLSEHQELKRHWRQIGGPGTLAMAEIFCHPNKLERLFYDFLFPKMFSDSREEAVDRFFADSKNAALAAEAAEQLRASERYTAYLKENGLYDEIGEAEAKLAEKRAKILHTLFPT